MAKCPSCANRNLSATLLTAGLSAKGCHSCNGALIDLLSYRAWADQKGVDVAQTVPAETVAIDDTGKAMTCPLCSSVMNKYSVSESVDNKLDFCVHCDVAWLDSGEWDQLNDIGLRNGLGTVFTEPWQRKIKRHKATQVQETVRRQRFGDDYERIQEFRTWIQAHPQFESAIAWIRDND